MNNPTHNKEGAALVSVLAFTILSTILAGALLSSSASQARVANSQVNLEKALFLAEAGVERAAQYLESQQGYLPQTYANSGTVGDGAYTFNMNKIGWRAYEVDSVGTVNGKSRQVHIDRLYIPTYAQFALWMHTNGEIYFIPGEEFFGQVHSNDKLWFYSNPIDGGPVFWKELSSAWDHYGGTLDWATLHMGFELDSDMGQMADVNFTDGAFSLKSLAGSLGLVLEGDTTIAFQDENMLITNDRAGWADEVVPIGDDQLVYIERSYSGDSSTQAGKLYLDGGDVDGRVTLVTENDIRINDNINYTYDPASYPESDNALGLIAQDDVWITQEAPDSLEVDAAILAAGTRSASNRGSFGVLNYYSGAPRGPLNIFGSIVQDKRGAVGTFNDQGMVSGYYKNYSFDERFSAQAPPYYPVIDEQVKFEGWSEGPYS